MLHVNFREYQDLWFILFTQFSLVPKSMLDTIFLRDAELLSGPGQQ